ncbi:hypothetical protein ZYGR_0U00470 [Zygosaccharomyces rouxii]|uniref:ZYRO0F09768p n=2 Tax=Zygosaccharomyces rouxii TaxID=4956 RepID=C5DY28_ZYGRC|nr:uncharacterized protein ZYRO0F09768g [Zygosaccharomyces rouxii]KAH9199447.1 Cys/Met metabolism PLP-dependent enzyme-domain-containing protein [Zygosaccharomyces rouxii]GAV50191.1 hypothetical protein ZYGR_0U00470 [Zygosaccharomyces rouxii]CAR28689.1 ZYRO0F09768p [Zygosaccharomyces rouxii]
MVDLETLLLHGDDEHNRVTDVAPPINVASTFRYDNDNLIPWRDQPNLDFLDENPVYSREGHPNGVRLEALFSRFLGGHAICYSCGLGGFLGVMVHFNPKRVFMDQCYHGVQGIVGILKRNYGVERYGLADIEKHAQKGDIVHVETPINPFGTSLDISELARRAHSKGALLMVDSTFAPPPLQNAWDFGADMIMHSATKYFAGHSDLLSGVLVVKDKEVASKLKEDRIYLGSNIANLESYLLLRSLRTYDLRIRRQAENATKVVKYLNDHKDKYPALVELYHSSLQTEEFVKKQLSGGYTPVFSLTFKTEEQCKKFCSSLKLFQHATSLGGVESLVEWRAMCDSDIDQCLVRVSIGCESADDLINDLSTVLSQL